MNDNIKNNQHWKEASDICESIESLSIDEKIQHINSLDLSIEVQEKALKIISLLNEPNTLLDGGDYSVYLQDIAKDKDLVNHIIDDYKLVKLIAKGGMSSIYKAVHTQSAVKKHVAIKILSPYMFTDKSLELFKREQLILSKLDHPCISSFHHSGQTEDGMQYLVMEYIDGARSIVDYGKDEKLSTKQIVALIKQISEVSLYAHNNLIIHRDIKSDNILIDKQGHVKIIDFGIGQFESDKHQDTTQVYTASSASPEQLLGKNITVQTDVFSLGALLLQLLVKKDPLPKTDVRHYDPLDDVKHINNLLNKSQLDKDLKNIILTAMHIDVQKRYASMQSFAQDLKNWQDSKPVSATADNFTYRFSKLISRNPLTSVLSFLIVTSAIITAFFIMYYSSEAQTEANRAKQTLEILTQVFKQADDWDSENNNITLREALKEFSNSVSYGIEIDDNVRFNVEVTLAEIFGNMTDFKASVKHYNNAYLLSKKIHKAGSLKQLNVRFHMAQISLTAAEVNNIVQICEENLAIINKQHPDDIELKLKTLALLLDTMYFRERYKLPMVNELQQQILTLLDSYSQKEPTILIISYNALAASYQFQKSPDFELADKYLTKSLEISKVLNMKKPSFGYFNTSLALVKMKTRLKKFDEAAQLALDGINTLKKVKPDSASLVFHYGTYADILFRLQKKEETFDAISSALEIIERTDFDYGRYYILYKRAVFRLKGNEFKLAILDQLKLLQTIIKISSKNNLRIAINLDNFANNLYMIDQADLANKLIEYSISMLQATGNTSNKSIASKYALLSLLNLSVNNTEKSKYYLQIANDTDDITNNIHAKIVKQLLSQDNGNLSDYYEGEKLTFGKNLYNILLLNQDNEPKTLNIESLQAQCVIDDNYTQGHIVYLKEVYLSQCISLYKKYDYPEPAWLKQDLDKINKGKMIAQEIPSSFIEEEVNKILALIQ